MYLELSPIASKKKKTFTYFIDYFYILFSYILHLKFKLFPHFTTIDNECHKNLTIVITRAMCELFLGPIGGKQKEIKRQIDRVILLHEEELMCFILLLTK